MQSDHSVLDCYTMQKGLFIIQKVCIWKPKLVSNSVIQCEVEREGRICQALITPTLLEIHGDGIVLQRKNNSNQIISKSLEKKFVAFSNMQVVILSNSISLESNI